MFSSTRPWNVIYYAGFAKNTFASFLSLLLLFYVNNSVSVGIIKQKGKSHNHDFTVKTL